MLENCKICGHPPTSYSSKTQHKGCDITIWVVECDHFEEDVPFPFCEHRLTIYGKDKDEAEKRWNIINNNKEKDLNKVISELTLYFTSGNNIPVERATILAKDFWRIMKGIPKEI